MEPANRIRLWNWCRFKKASKRKEYAKIFRGTKNVNAAWFRLRPIKEKSQISSEDGSVDIGHSKEQGGGTFIVFLYIE
jgi:hypothetical protein